MIDNIKNMWSGMLKETQKKAVDVLMENFDLRSRVYVKQTWIWNGGIPEKDQEEVVKIFQNLLLDQSKSTEKLAS